MKRLIILFLSLITISQSLFADIPPHYYDSADGKTKDALKAAMKDIITQAQMLAYGSGEGRTWSGFYQTDRFNGNQVRDRYSYQVFYFANTTSAPSGMNIEHSFPKSWWGGTENNAYKDLFNLMPCEQNINSKKSNYGMGVVTTVSTNNGCTKVGKGNAGGQTKSLWEPADEWKGDFARGYMYMATAYSNFTWTGEGLTMLQQGAYPTFKPWAYELLLQWSRQDPVDDIERERNDAVYAIQGNRNPFVDFPNLCEYIWGDSISYTFSIDGTSTGGGDTIPGPTPDPDPKVEGSFTEDFETASKGAYTDGEIAGTACSWFFSNALIGTQSGGDSTIGDKAVRAKSGGSITMLADKSDGCQTLSFYAGAYKSDTGLTLTVSYSTDQGTTWTDVATGIDADIWQCHTLTLAVEGSIRLRFTVGGTSSKRLNIDQIVMTSFDPSAITTPHSAISATAPAGIYSISGVRLPQPQPGINIIGGKKVIVK